MKKVTNTIIAKIFVICEDGTKVHLRPFWNTRVEVSPTEYSVEARDKHSNLWMMRYDNSTNELLSVAIDKSKW